MSLYIFYPTFTNVAQRTRQAEVKPAVLRRSNAVQVLVDWNLSRIIHFCVTYPVQ